MAQQLFALDAKQPAPVKMALCKLRNNMSPTIFREKGYRFYFFSEKKQSYGITRPPLLVG